MRTKGTEQAQNNWDRGKDIPHTVQPISVKYPAEVDAVLRSLPDRSERIRQWVIEGLRRDGLVD